VLNREFAARDALVVNVRGAIDMREMTRVKSMIDEGIATNPRVVLAMAAVEAIAPMTLGLLLGAAIKLRERGGDLKLAGLAPELRTTFKLFGLRQFFETYGSVEEAIESFDEAWEGPEQ